MKPSRSLECVHPVLVDCIHRIQKIIDKHSIPMALFETGRTRERHTYLLSKGKVTSIVSSHLYDMESDPPLYATGVDYVYFDNRWSWNLRDDTILSWYVLFGNLVLDECPELKWKGQDRKNKNYCHFSLRQSVIYNNIDKIPCVLF